MNCPHGYGSSSDCPICRERRLAEIEREQAAVQAMALRPPGPLPRPSAAELVAQFGLSDNAVRLMSVAATDAAGTTTEAELRQRHEAAIFPQLPGVNAGPIPEGIYTERYREFRGPVRRCAGGCLTPVAGFEIYCPACIPDDWAH